MQPERRHDMPIWLKIILAIIIWFVVALIAVAILQVKGLSTRSLPVIVGGLAAVFFMLRVK